jgi:hypothetical protein
MPKTDDDNPITRLADAVMRAFGRLTADAPNDCPFQRARLALGERFADVACAALRQSTLAALTDEENKRLVIEAPRGLPVGEAIMATILADAIKEVIAEANQQTQTIGE